MDLQALSAACQPADDYVRRVLSAYVRKAPITKGPDRLSQWDRIHRTIAVHGLEGVFHYALNGVTPAPPPEMWHLWQKRSMAVLFDNLRSLRTAADLFALLDNHSIKAVAMRGLTLAHKDYASAGMRSMGDIDILIDPEDCQRFLDVVGRAGMAPQKVLRSQYVLRIDSVLFEIHWSFLTAKRYRDLLGSEQLLSSRRPHTTQDGEIYCLSDENELIGLVTHAFVHHDLGVLNQLLDIAIFMVKPDLDWDFLRHWCDRARLARMFALTLHLAERLFMLKVEGFRHAFADRVTPRVKTRYADYAHYYFGMARLGSHLRRRADLLYVAEPPMTKLKQLLRFCNFAEVRDLFRRSGYSLNEKPQGSAPQR